MMLLYIYCAIGLILGPAMIISYKKGESAKIEYKKSLGIEVEPKHENILADIIVTLLLSAFWILIIFYMIFKKKEA